MPINQIHQCAGVVFRYGPCLPAEQIQRDRNLLDPAASAQESVDGHLARLSAIDHITEPMVSTAPITGSLSEAWT